MSCYAEAAKFDEVQQEKWLKANFVAFCRRTERPKLGYIIHRLNLAGIACILHGDSFHAPILCSREEAWREEVITFADIRSNAKFKMIVGGKVDGKLFVKLTVDLARNIRTKEVVLVDSKQAVKLIGM